MACERSGGPGEGGNLTANLDRGGSRIFAEKHLTKGVRQMASDGGLWPSITSAASSPIGAGLGGYLTILNERRKEKRLELALAGREGGAWGHRLRGAVCNQWPVLVEQERGMANPRKRTKPCATHLGLTWATAS
jgi:hypothetical protein